MALQGGLPSGKACVGRGPALEASESLAWAPGRIHTWIVEVEVQRVPDLAAGLHGTIGAVELREVAHTLVPQVAHEELQADEGEDAEAEDGEDHHIGQLLHGLDQRPHNGLQALGVATTSRESPTRTGPPTPLHKVGAE